MITLEDLKPAEGAVKNLKRVGRGRSSGHGKTSCRGHNGEGQRSGRTAKRGFEGGQMPAFRRLPKLKGFNNIHALNAAVVNVSVLEKLDMKEIDLAYLKENKLVHSSSEVLRILETAKLLRLLTLRLLMLLNLLKKRLKKQAVK